MLVMWWIVVGSLWVMPPSIDPSPVLERLEESKWDYLIDRVDDKNVQFSLRNEEDMCESHIDYNQDGTMNINIYADKFHVDQTDQGEAYMCTTHKVPNNDSESFITKFIPLASMASVDHVIVYGCNAPKVSEKKMWNCLSHLDLCSVGPVEILYAWATGAPSLTLPPQVGLRVGGASGIQHLVVQVHYTSKRLHGSISCPGVTMVATQQKQTYFAGVMITRPGSINIPPYSRYSKSDVSCRISASSALNVFAFRTHTHHIGTVVTGYRVRNGSAVIIGKGNPQWPQAFYSRIGGPITVFPDDGLLVRCVYKSNRPTITQLGFRGSDDMCNFFMMYFSSSPPASQLICFGDNLPSSAQLFPSTADDLSPYPGYAGRVSTVAIETGAAVQPEVPETNPSNQLSRSQRSSLPSRAVDEIVAPDSHYKYQELVADLQWPVFPDIGQVGGVTVDDFGRLHVFHRSYRRWGHHSFLPFTDIFAAPQRPITNDTVTVLDLQDGAVVHSWGAGMFYMPHGATVVGNDSLWLADAAMHQVFKFPLYGRETPLLTLGVKLEPGDDERHFCKPTDVAVDWEGMVYVADGYCNGRIVKFTPDGMFVKSWGERNMGASPPPPLQFNIVHSITIIGDDEVCAADRENGRIQCFTLDGELTRVIEHREVMGGNVYAIAYSASYGGVIYAVNGPSISGGKTSGFTIDSQTGTILQQWNPSSIVDLTHPHDVAVSPNDKQVYVGQLSDRKVYKFDVIATQRKPHVNTPS